MNKFVRFPIINYEARENNLDSFLLLAECKNGILTFNDITLLEDESDVYAIQFGDELYVGSSSRIRRRIRQHFCSLRANRHAISKMQELYNSSHSFRVFIIMRCANNRDLAEQMVIHLLRPSLNTTLPKGNRNPFNHMLWTLSDTAEEIIDMSIIKDSHQIKKIETSIEKNIVKVVGSKGFTRRQMEQMGFWAGHEFYRFINNPSLVKLIKLSQILDVPLSELVKPSKS